MIITTSYEPDQLMMKRAYEIAEKTGARYIHRNKNPINKMFDTYQVDELIVIEKAQSKYISKDKDHPFFFHPSMATLRINRIKQGDNDLMVQISNLKRGDSFLDCTFGLGTDSIVASFVVGASGKVVGLESENILAALVQDGLSLGWPKDKEIDEAMKRIEVRNTSHYQELKFLPDKSFDVIYFDPMFRKGNYKSSSMNPLREIANKEPISQETIIEAKRVARKKIILKEDIRSKEFQRLGFEPITRSTSITYGVIRLDGVD